MVRRRGAAGTGRMVAGVLALMLGAAPAVSQSHQPAGPARFFRIQDVLNRLSAGKPPAREQSVRLAARVDGILSDVPLRGSIPQIGDEPFGLFAFRAPEGLLWKKWRGVRADIEAGAAEIARCREHADCTPAARRYLDILAAAAAREGHERLDEVNRQVNGAIRYAGDLAQHSVADRWSAPLDTFAAGRGDCEDYAIAKYVILRDAGMPASDLRLLLVRDRLARDDHAVLAARLEGRWLILDNRFSAIPEDSRMYNFTPLFALDEEGVKLMAAPYAKVPIRMEFADAQPAGVFEGEPALRGAVDPATQEGGAPAPDAGL